MVGDIYVTIDNRHGHCEIKRSALDYLGRHDMSAFGLICKTCDVFCIIAQLHVCLFQE